mmetsp:Transcript_133059/g.413722  ORF Transcript_133059/g.413722 Transcript_133059/m.413722 type:complete len:257 (+) Transcript_133059:1-771(+)
MQERLLMRTEYPHLPPRSSRQQPALPRWTNSAPRDLPDDSLLLARDQEATACHSDAAALLGLLRAGRRGYDSSGGRGRGGAAGRLGRGRRRRAELAGEPAIPVGQRGEALAVAHGRKGVAAGQVVPGHVPVVVLANFAGLREPRRRLQRRGPAHRRVRGQADADAPAFGVINGVVPPEGCLPQHPQGPERRGQLDGLDGEGAVVPGDLCVVLAPQDHVEGSARGRVEAQAHGWERGPARTQGLQQHVHLRRWTHHQ